MSTNPIIFVSVIKTTDYDKRGILLLCTDTNCIVNIISSKFVIELLKI